MANNTFKFQSRSEAGYILARRLQSYAKLRDVVVLALPRGGVPVGAEIANLLKVPLFVFMVRKLGVPGHEELAMGAITNGGSPLINTAVTKRLWLSKALVDTVVRRETRELSRRERLYCRGQQMPELREKIVVLTDDGAATGASLSLAVQAVQQRGAAYVIVAVPVAPPHVVAQLNKIADEVVCLMEPKRFIAVSNWYQEFLQLTDREVCQILEPWSGKTPERQSA